MAARASWERNLAIQASPAEKRRRDLTAGASIDLDWARDIVVGGIADSSLGTRRTAVEALASIDGAWAGRALGLALRDRDEDTRIRVVRSLWARWMRGEHGGATAEPWWSLEACVAPDATQLLRMTALLAIGELASQCSGDVDAIILQVLRRGDFDDLRAARSSIARLPSLSADLSAELRRIVEKDDVRVLLAADVLAEHRDLSVEPTLLRLAASDDSVVRSSAVRSLGKLGPGVGAETRRLFAALAERDDQERDAGWEGLLRCSTREQPVNKKTHGASGRDAIAGCPPACAQESDLTPRATGTRPPAR